jgi:hypothetical protein
MVCVAVGLAWSGHLGRVNAGQEDRLESLLQSEVEDSTNQLWKEKKNPLVHIVCQLSDIQLDAHVVECCVVNHSSRDNPNQQRTS